jgi:centromere protein I
MELIRQVGNEPPLVGLLRVFKDYYPDIIVGDAVSGRASVFTVGLTPPRASNTNLDSIQIRNGENGLPIYKLFLFTETKKGYERKYHFESAVVVQMARTKIKLL